MLRSGENGLAAIVPSSVEPPTQTAAIGTRPLSSERSNDTIATVAQATVARHLNALALDRRALVSRIAQQLGVSVPFGIDEFFQAAAAGKWHELDARFRALQEQLTSPATPEEVQKLLAPVFETYCVAELVQTLPAEKLLEYGQALLDSIGSATVYVSSSEKGQWISTLLNATRESDRKIIIAESLLSDPAYIDYLRFLYPGRLANLSSQDLSHAHRACVMRREQGAPSSTAENPPQSLADEINQQLLQTLANMNPQLAIARELPRTPSN